MNTSKMSPEEYAAFTGAKSYPAGLAKASIEAGEVRERQAVDADYVSAFIRDLEDPDKRLVTENLHDWKTYGTAGKAAILFALKEFVAMQRAKQ